MDFKEKFEHAPGDFKHCPNCGGVSLSHKDVDGRLRQVCGDCGRVFYKNPIPSVVGVCEQEGKILLVKRAVPPGVGSWCLPGGFIEAGETTVAAIKRELEEETGFEIEPLSVIDVCTDLGGYYGDVLLVGYRVKIIGGENVPGDDALEAKFFAVDEIPRLTFRCHHELLNKALETTNG
ncbi:MAG: NUDIX hydrolase [Thermoplasmata archaeon]|nr:NUDIX hydrolase [Thermoplasmata archaeon]